MNSISFSNFQVGIVDNPSIEDKGGFEFASGMDIFSEPGVMKANFAMTPVSGFTPTQWGFAMDTTLDGSTLRGYLGIEDKIYTSTDGVNWSLFLTNTNGRIESLKVFNGYIFYSSDPQLGRCPVNNAAAKNDSWQALSSTNIWHPMLIQAGTLKIGDGRYIMSIDESFTVTAQAMKAPIGYTLWTTANYQNRMFMGSMLSANGIGFPSTEDATVFDWNGIPLASGSALPDNSYHSSKRGMGLLISTGQGLFGFPDRKAEITLFNGAVFVPFRQLNVISASSDMNIRPFNGCEHLDTVLFIGDNTFFPGAFQMKGSAICQAFVPSVITPGASEQILPTLLASGFDGKVFMSYQRVSDSSYHMEYLSSNRQNNAMVRTLWHRARTDSLKRWGGIKLNLKPLPASTAVDVAYRTSRNAAFSSSMGTITSANQDRPLIFPAQPRTREIQYQLTFTTATTNTPELLSYDPVFEILKTLR